MNVSGASDASRWSKRATYVRATPCALKISIFWRSEDRRRVECEHRRRQREIVRGLDKPGEHRLMAAMDAVEIADRQCHGNVGGRRQAAKDPHE